MDGLLNNKPCTFRIDTGSDVSVLNVRLSVNFRQIPLDFCNLRYPTGERVPVISRVLAAISLGKFNFEMPFYVADINDECILGIDFLEKAEVFEGFFENTLGLTKSVKGEHGLICSRIEDCPALLPIFEQGSSHLDPAQKLVFFDFLKEFYHVFSENIIAGNCDVLCHTIELCDSHPIKQVPRRIPLHLRTEVNKILEEMKDQKVIEESSSPWVSPVVLVKKKDGSIRFCVDYRRVNAVTKKDSFPLPRIDNILDCLAGNSWFCTIDLKSGYWQFQGKEERVIAYFSRVLSKTERNYCVTRRELLAVVDSVKSFRHYLYGRKFLVRTDHVSLRWLMSFRNLEGQLARWLERLQQYDFDVYYRSGKAHGNADGLSRRPCLETSCRYCAKIELNEESEEKTCGRIVFVEENLQEWRSAQLQDPIVSKIIQAKEAGRRPDW
ncbi:uncharacterized protein LOC143905721 isoform X1 [Temnothorax americanus]|uniref:uncharacterized protein LOC143905721 isoform X1 n=1 Tax=Temnothorax americanus TaxID=1964332 RepID=UPI004068F7F7